MDYAAYRQYRDAVLAVPGGGKLRRFDCMNPVKALAPLLVAPAVASGIEDPVDAWLSATAMPLDRGRTVLARGVRELLAAAFAALSHSEVELWLPDDVYPVYWTLAREAGLTPHAFATLPRPRLTFCDESSRPRAAVLPVPLSPLGRPLLAHEAEEVLGWLRRSPRSILIVDAVYTYDFLAAGPFVQSLLHEFSEQCLLLWSCAKSWLAPGCLGIGSFPKRMRPNLASEIPNNWRLPPGLPLQQQRAFDREWQRLAPVLRDAAPAWEPPVSGYFSVVDAPFESLLNHHGILSVPATVFGSPHKHLSIVTCLHDLAAHEAVQ